VGKPKENQGCDGCDGSNQGGVRAGGPDPNKPTTWTGRDDKGRPTPGGDLLPGEKLPGEAAWWRQPGEDWTEVERN
jgi:hypothetical protein